MTEVRFYHLENQSAENALPALLLKALENNHRIIVKTTDKNRAQQLSDHLWVYNPNAFIPHGTKEDGYSADQPVFITYENDNPNKADTLILIDGADAPPLDDFKLCCKLFDGSIASVKEKTRAQWKTLKDQKHQLTYWQQGAKGWEKKD